MQNLYYKIWVDAIVSERKLNSQTRDWRLFTLLPMTVIQMINLFTIIILLKGLGITLNIFWRLDVIPEKALDTFLTAFIIYILPLLAFNYFLIFKDEKYKKLIEKYEYKNGRLYAAYFILSFGIFIGYIVLTQFVFK